MACIIAEAFPSYSIDEIESWNNFKFMKIYSQAEWVLTNMRDIHFQFDIVDYLAEVAGITEEELIDMGIKDTSTEPVPQPQQVSKQPIQQQASATPKQGNNGKMTPEQMKAYQDFVRQHPEFADAMQYDSAFTGFESQTADTVNPALRPGWYHNH